MLPFGPPIYRLWKLNFGQKLHAKLWCYWEHLGELIGSLGIIWELWEHGVNTKNWTPQPWPFKGKKDGPFRYMLNCLINYIKKKLLKLFVPIFGLGWYKYISPIIMFLVWFISNNCRGTSKVNVFLVMGIFD